MEISPEAPKQPEKKEEVKIVEKQREPEISSSQTHSIADDFTPIKSLTTLNPDWII